MRPVGSVQLPISEFRDRVRDFDGDSAGLAEWIRKFSYSLSYVQPDLDDFAAKLLVNVEDFRTKKASAMKNSRQKQQPKQSADFSEDFQNSEFPLPAENGELSEIVTSDGEVLSGRKSKIPESIADVYDFGRLKNISESTCHAFWDINEKNKWQFKGRIKNWKGALIAFSKVDIT